MEPTKALAINYAYIEDLYSNPLRVYTFANSVIGTLVTFIDFSSPDPVEATSSGSLNDIAQNLGFKDYFKPSSQLIHDLIPSFARYSGAATQPGAFKLQDSLASQITVMQDDYRSSGMLTLYLSTLQVFAAVVLTVLTPDSIKPWAEFISYIVAALAVSTTGLLMNQMHLAWELEKLYLQNGQTSDANYITSATRNLIMKLVLSDNLPSYTNFFYLYRLNQ
eukprot:403369150